MISTSVKNMGFVQQLSEGRSLFCEANDPEGESGELIYYDGERKYVIDTEVKEFLYLEPKR